MLFSNVQNFIMKKIFFGLILEKWFCIDTARFVSREINILGAKSTYLNQFAGYGENLLILFFFIILCLQKVSNFL